MTTKVLAVELKTYATKTSTSLMMTQINEISVNYLNNIQFKCWAHIQKLRRRGKKSKGKYTTFKRKNNKLLIKEFMN